MSSFWWQPNNIQLPGNILRFEAVNKTAANKQLMRQQTSHKEKKKLTMSQQHKSGGARYIQAINKSEDGSSWDKMLWERMDNLNAEKALVYFEGKLLKKNNCKGQKSLRNNEGVRRISKAQGVFMSWNSWCSTTWPTVLLNGAAAVAPAARWEVVTHLHLFVSAAARVGLVPEVQLQQTHTTSSVTGHNTPSA